MNVVKALKNHYLRIDARSLGLFRITFGLLLVFDLFRRWRQVRDFYSNEGVLPNHNHLFVLFTQKGEKEVWSFLHAFSTVGENNFAFLLILGVFVAFLLGIKTRVFHALSLACLISLTGRNILLENAGNYAAIALLAFTLFLPTGSRFSLDSLRASMAARDEKGPKALNDRAPVDPNAIEAARAPGFSPVSLAAFAALAQIAIIYQVSAMAKTGAWRDGTALYYALHVERWVSPLGASLRGLSPGALSGLTRLVYGAEWAIPLLILLPFAFRFTRGAAIALMVVHGLVLGLFFSFGIYAWTLVAAAPLLISPETWDRIEGKARPGLRRTVIYDVDCGMCLWLARLLKRVDLRQHVTFQGNDSLEEGLIVRRDGGAEGGTIERADMPKEVTPALVNETVVVVDATGRVYTRARAIAAIVRVLPLGGLVSWIMLVPGIAQLLDVLYGVVATRRQAISVAMGKGACGITPPDAEDDAYEAPSAEVAPATRLRRLFTGGLRELAVMAIFAAMLAQTSQANPVPFKVPQGKALYAIAAWPRMMARWDVMTPEPPKTDAMLVVDAQTRGGKSVDLLTGKTPEFDPAALRGTRLGQMWNDYLARLHDKDWEAFQKAFRDYLTRGGRAWQDKTGDEVILGFDVYWVEKDIPAPGAAPQGEPQGEPRRERLFTHSRGGLLGAGKTLPLFRPPQPKP